MCLKRASPEPYPRRKRNPAVNGSPLLPNEFDSLCDFGNNCAYQSYGYFVSEVEKDATGLKSYFTEEKEPYKFYFDLNPEG